MVRLAGLEPVRLSAPDPKSGASTNFATGAAGTWNDGAIDGAGIQDQTGGFSSNTGRAGFIGRVAWGKNNVPVEPLFLYALSTFRAETEFSQERLRRINRGRRKLSFKHGWFMSPGVRVDDPADRSNKGNGNATTASFRSLASVFPF